MGYLYRIEHDLGRIGGGDARRPDSVERGQRVVVCLSLDLVPIKACIKEAEEIWLADTRHLLNSSVAYFQLHREANLHEVMSPVVSSIVR